MWNKEELIALLKGDWHSINFENRVAEIIEKSPKTVPLLVKLAKHNDNRVAWRAAYLLDKIHDKQAEIVTPYLHKIIKVAEGTTNESIKRHYLRILTHYDLSDKVSGRFVDLCFQWLHQKKTKTAVKAYLMQILFNLTQQYPELAPELKASLLQLPADVSAGVQNRAKKILVKL